MSRFATLDSLKKKKDDDKPDDDETNRYYVGGARGQGGGSGLNVIAPDDDGNNADPYKKAIAKAAKEAQENGALREDEDYVEVTIFQNGFQIADGEFRQRGVPLNDEFMDSISRGICPREMLRNGQPVNVKLNDKSSEDYVPPSYTAFSGSGNQIGGGRAVDASNVIKPLIGENAKAPEVNEGELVIRVRIRYPDNKNEVAKFNRHHTVNDLISVVHASGKVSVPFVLQGPNRQPINSSMFASSLTDAGLANAMVVVSTKI